jgi:hypothetical protein
MIDYIQLKSELQEDPTSQGYATPLAAGDHVAVAALLNEVDAGIQIDRTQIARREVMEAIVWSEFEGATATKRDTVKTLMTLDNFNVNAQNVKDGFLGVFGAGTGTRTNLTAMLNRPGSRAEQLFGEGAQITHTDIAIALAS